jgi:hypothetical protein
MQERRHEGSPVVKMALAASIQTFGDNMKIERTLNEPVSVVVGVVKGFSKVGVCAQHRTCPDLVLQDAARRSFPRAILAGILGCRRIVTLSCVRVREVCNVTVARHRKAVPFVRARSSAYAIRNT